MLWQIMFYVYIIFSPKFHGFYIGSTNDLKDRVKLHNGGKVKSTKPHTPWRLVWYCAFVTEKEARNFELYLKTGSGRSFAYKRLISVALAKDFSHGRKSSPKTLL
jgi:predicted GIY-YIG superfamily endonuclease